MVTGTHKFNIGPTLNKLVARSGKQKNAIAAHMGVSDQAVQKWLKKGTVAREHVPTLCAYLDCSADELFGMRPIGEPASASRSHTARLDPDIVQAVARAMQDTAQELKVSIGTKDVVEIFAEMYERIGESGLNTADVVWLVRRLEQGGGNDKRRGNV
jgi:DNA-binding Xre family transcriptional regulator